MSGGKEYIANYGTLKREYIRKLDDAVYNQVKNKLRYLGTCYIPGRLYEVGNYPGLKLGGADMEKVEVELYEILESDIIDTLDRYEGYIPSDPGSSLFLKPFSLYLNRETVT
ncbi:MAG: gamma-glutamylcyclotransferase [Halobacteria archaeon]